MPTKPEKDEYSGVETTGHEWDGIKELNTPLPRWWVYIFVASIAFSLLYWVLYPAWPTFDGYSKGVLGWSRHSDLAEEIDAAKARQSKFLTAIGTSSVGEILTDHDLLAFARAGGRSAFVVNCSQCHGMGASGGVGYPNLNDDEWLWGGDIDAIEQTIRYGIRSDHEDARYNDMPAFLADELLTAETINDVAEYVLSLTDRAGDQAAATRGAAVFEEECTVCHGDDAGGMYELGGPALNDHVWLYGGEKDDIVASASFARRGVMPAWVGRLDDATIKQLAIYVHTLGGGE